MQAAQDVPGFDDLNQKTVIEIFAAFSNRQKTVDISVEEGCNAHFPSARPIAQWMDSIDQPSQVSTFCLRERHYSNKKGLAGSASGKADALP